MDLERGTINARTKEEYAQFLYCQIMLLKRIANSKEKRIERGNFLEWAKQLRKSDKMIRQIERALIINGLLDVSIENGFLEYMLSECGEELIARLNAELSNCSKKERVD